MVLYIIYETTDSSIECTDSRGQKKVKCCISFLRHLLHCIKKQNIPQDAAWKKLQFRKDSLFYSCTFCFQNERNSEALSDVPERMGFSVFLRFLLYYPCD